MDTINCQKCEKPIDPKFKNCPHCGYMVFKKPKSGCFKAIGIASIFLVLFFWMGTCDSDTGNNTYDHSEGTAYLHAEDYIETLLKSPKTAQFPNYRDRQGHVVRSGGQYVINSYVDSQNSFGALVRTKWSCIVTYDSDKVKITNVKFDE